MRTKPVKLRCYRIVQEMTRNMWTIAADPKSFSWARSRTTTSWAGTASANTWSGYYPIHEGIQIHVSRPDATASVIQPFYVKVRLVADEYIASRTLSNSYEFGVTPGQSIKNYLEFLVDLLPWL